MAICEVNSDKDAEMLSLKHRPQAAGAQKLELVVQGRKLCYFGPPDVRSLLDSQGENSVYANVRLNGTILRRRDFENIPLNEGDSIDFLYFMGGGIDKTNG